jgi:soluble lytic murein transglycosylase
MASWAKAPGYVHLLFVAACSRESARPNPSDGARPAVVADAEVAGDGAVTDAAPHPSPLCAFAECVRRHDWARADGAYGSLSDAARQAPSVAIARARVLLALGRASDALVTLDDLEPTASAFATTILRVRVDALRWDPRALRGRPDVVNAVATTLARSTDPRARLEAVPLLDDSATAESTLDRLVTDRKMPQDVAIAARRLRAARGGPHHSADTRWLFINAPGPADTAPNGPLTTHEWIKRADAFARQGSTDAALASSAKAEGAARRQGERDAALRHRAYVLYKSRTHYLEAAQLLSALGLGGGVHASEDAFHAARALSRADHDEEAIAAYEALARAKPRSEWGMRAAYFVGYLRALHGEWAQAEIALHRFLAMGARIPETKDARRFLAIAAYAQEQWSLARTRFRELARDTRSANGSLRARHLAALADARGGGQDGQLTWQSIAATEPFSFPGVMARARLRRAGRDVAPLPPIGPRDPEATLSAEASALHATGLDDDAEAMLETQLTRSPLREACASFDAIDRAHGRAVRSGAIPGEAVDRGERWAWACLFPTPYKVWTTAESGVSPALLWSVMRQESGFNPRATSPALARGLLQLVDDTARATENALGIAAGDPYDPQHNIALGKKYLGKLLDRFGGQEVLAIAAYNAGPEAIARWLRRTKLTELEVFVEFIPYHETRNYVARVLSNYARYLWLTQSRTLELSPLLLTPDRSLSAE